MTEIVRIKNIICGNYYDTVVCDLDGIELQIAIRQDTVPQDYIGLDVLFSNEDGCSFSVIEGEYQVLTDNK